MYSRRGSVHLEQAIPFLNKGLPLFIDKPFTSDPKDAIRLADLIQRSACRVLGGSGCKYCATVQQIKAQVEQLREQKKLQTAMLHFPIMLDSAYDGFYFYAPHLVEMCLEIFGKDILSIQAMQLENCLVANLKYSDCIVSLHFVAEVWKHSCTLVTTEGPLVQPIVTSDSLSETAERFARMLQGQYVGMASESLTLPVMLTGAIARSASIGATVLL